MFRFTVKDIKISNKKFKVYKLKVVDYETNNIINKSIISKESLIFKEGNSYSCKIEKEDEDNIYINNIEQIDFDISIIREFHKYFSKHKNIDYIKNIFINDSLENIIIELNRNNSIEDKEILEKLVYFHNKNNILIFFYKYNIDSNSNEIKGTTIEYILNKYSNKDIYKLFLEKSFLIEYYFKLDLKTMKRINNKQYNLNLIILILFEIEKEGHAFAYIKQIEELLNEKYSFNIKNLKNDLCFLESEDLIKIIDNKVYFIENYKAEINIINRIKEINNIKIVKDNKLEDIIKDEINNLNFKLDKEQETAIYKALENNLTIITGGAGTGKTTIIDIIIKCINRLYINNKVRVAAFTGKAVNVINNKLTLNNNEALTLHKMFNIKENRFYNEFSKKRLDYLIIDEVSMLDIKLLNIVLSSIDKKTKLILIGDINQAEPIGIGAPIMDIIKSETISIVQLNKNNRSKCNVITMNAENILKNNNLLEYKNDEFEIIESPNINKMLLDKMDKLLNEGNDINNILILTFKNKNVKNINEKIASYNCREIRERRKIIAGDKVIQIKNNNNNNVYNGEQGIVVKIFEDIDKMEVHVKFGDKLIKYNNNTLNEIELAYAVSIHKAQGSQSKIVILFLDKDDREHLNRNLLYTAITRAEERCIIIQESNIFNECISKVPKQKNSAIYNELIKLT